MLSRSLNSWNKYVNAHVCDMSVEALRPEHWPGVLEIYLAGIAGGQATFETNPPTWEAWDAAHHSFARLVVTNDGEIAGWAALSPVSARHVYRGVAEVSVYVRPKSQGQGYGHVLLTALITESEQHGIWTMQASIFPENVASISLHSRCGFREVGRRERIGKLNGIWRTTVLMERRSQLVGLD
jgi:L-amino acid N-acyltransferase YncA